MFSDDSIGGMIVCDSSQQAKTVFEELQKYEELSKRSLEIIK